MYLVDQIVAVQVYIVSFSTVDHIFAFSAGESFVARSTVESVTTFHKDSGHRNAFDKVIAVQGVDLVHPMVPIIRSPFLVPPRSPSGAVGQVITTARRATPRATSNATISIDRTIAVRIILSLLQVRQD